MASFTPINAMPPPVQFISPRETLHERDIYEMVDDFEEQSLTPVTIPKKRGRTKSNGRATANQWEHVNDSVLDGEDDGAQFVVTSPKRRKSVPTSRSRLPSSPPPNTLPSLWADDGNQATNFDESDPNTPQLTTPPDSSKAKTKRAASAKPRVTKPKMAPFKAPKITKPSIPRQKEMAKEIVTEEVAQQKPITYLGHVTSQQTVMLAQTTLDKLAAFRYMPPPATQISGPPMETQNNIQPSKQSKAPVRPETTERLLDIDTGRSLPEDTDIHDSTAPEDLPHSDQHSATSITHENHTDPANVFYAEAAWTDQVSSQSRYIDQVDEEHGPSSTGVPGPSPCMIDQEPQLLSEYQSEPLSSINQNDQLPLTSYTSRSEPAPTQHHADLRFSQYGPTFSYLKDLLNASAPLDSIYHVSGSTDEQEIHLPDLPRDVGAEMDLNGSTLPDASVIQVTKIEQGQPSSQILPVLDSAHQTRLDPSKYVQVERSDIEDLEMERNSVSKDYDMDEFDQGLDDSDLVELVSPQVIPATQYDPLENNSSSENGAKVRQQPTEEPHHDLSWDNISVPEVNMPESDDEFALDDDFEHELSQFDFEVVERCQPPASVQLTSDGGSTRGEVYDKSLQFSSPYRNAVSPNQLTNPRSAAPSPSSVRTVPDLCVDNAEDWSFISSQTNSNPPRSRAKSAGATQIPGSPTAVSTPETSSIVDLTRADKTESQMTPETELAMIDDSHLYEPMQPFARPNFPELIRDRSPIVGLSPQTFLRVCFRIGEMIMEGARRNALGENALIELFARVTHSSREPGTTRQHFQFADLWHDRPPFPSGVLANYKTPDLLRCESKVFIGEGEAKMARVFGKLRRDGRSSTGWVMDVVSIRMTDWEEIRWTKRIVGAGLIKSEK